MDRIKRRPYAVVIIAAFLFFATAMAAIVGWALLVPGDLLRWLSQFNEPAMRFFAAWGKMPGALLMGLAGACFVAGRGLLRGRKSAWRFAIALFTLNGVGDAASFIVTHDALRSATGFVLCSVFLFALTRRTVRDFCQK